LDNSSGVYIKEEAKHFMGDDLFESRAKRRARTDPNNRDFICPCGKSYLSYPALYTHIK